MEIKIGSRVFISTFFTFRRDRVVDITINSLGTTLYWMEAGGCYSAGELKLAN